VLKDNKHKGVHWPLKIRLEIWILLC